MVKFFLVIILLVVISCYDIPHDVRSHNISEMKIDDNFISFKISVNVSQVYHVDISESLFLVYKYNILSKLQDLKELCSSEKNEREKRGFGFKSSGGLKSSGGSRFGNKIRNGFTRFGSGNFIKPTLSFGQKGTIQKRIGGFFKGKFFGAAGVGESGGGVAGVGEGIRRFIVWLNDPNTQGKINRVVEYANDPAIQGLALDAPEILEYLKTYLISDNFGDDILTMNSTNQLETEKLLHLIYMEDPFVKLNKTNVIDDTIVSKEIIQESIQNFTDPKRILLNLTKGYIENCDLSNNLVYIRIEIPLIKTASTSLRNLLFISILIIMFVVIVLLIRCTYRRCSKQSYNSVTVVES